MSERAKVGLRSFAVGCVAAAISKTVVAPVERAKIILQVKPGHYKGLFSCMIGIVKDQPKNRSLAVRLLPLYRGNNVNVFRYFPMQAINFAVKGQIRKTVYGWGDTKNVGFLGHLWRSLLAGGAAGVVGLTFVYPLDFVRTLMASDMGVGREYKGFFDCCIKVIKRDGIFGLHKGFVPSVIGIFPYRASYFGFYDVAKRYLLSSEKGKDSFFKRWAVSQTTSVSAQYVAYPFDTVRRRMMLSTAENPLYDGMFDCFRKIWKEEGFLGLYKGAGANAVRATGAALCLVFYDTIGRFLFLDKDYGGN